MSSSGSLYVAPSSGIVFRARHIGCLNRYAYLDPLANNDRVESPSRDHSLNLRDLGSCNSGHVCHSLQHPSSPIYVSNPRASSTGDTCSVSGLAGTVDVHVSTLSPAHQSHSETMCQPVGWDNSNSPMVANTAMVPTPAPTVCGPPSLLYCLAEIYCVRGFK